MKIFTKKRVVLALGLVLAGVAVAAWLHSKKEQPLPASKYRTVAVDTGNITQTVTATGTINPVALINVGSQVSGTVVELKADFNDHVKKGQVLLKLDPTIFNAQIRQVEASVASAQASMRLAQANFERNQRLVGQNYVSALTLDQSRRELDVARANVKLADAQLARSQADFDNSVIRAPIDGVVIKRTIDLGQTVAASFTTPNLFQIARDLTKMQIDTSVSEADVGALKDGQPARFVVDAYPDREFDASMRQFRLAANVVANVVTYNVVLDVENKLELLKPGMTAQVRLVVATAQRHALGMQGSLEGGCRSMFVGKHGRLHFQSEEKQGAGPNLRYRICERLKIGSHCSGFAHLRIRFSPGCRTSHRRSRETRQPWP
jgi:HlyD family secretion protein